MMFQEAVQQVQQVAENPEIPWYYLTAAFAVGGAALEHGANTLSSGWEKELSLPKWFSVAGDVAGLTLAGVLGATVGHIVWHWHLGSAVAFTGAVASKLVLSLVKAKLGIVSKSSKKDDPPPGQ